MISTSVSAWLVYTVGLGSVGLGIGGICCFFPGRASRAGLGIALILAAAGYALMTRSPWPLVEHFEPIPRNLDDIMTYVLVISFVCVGLAGGSFILSSLSLPGVNRVTLEKVGRLVAGAMLVSACLGGIIFVIGR